MDKTSEKTLVIERVIDAPVAEVFNALTTEGKLRKWFYPIEKGFAAEVKFEAEVGESYHINMIDPNEKVYSHHGVIKELVPDRKLSFTWNSHVVEDTLVTIELKEIDAGRTKLVLVHDFKSGDEIEGHEKGWKELLENLNNLLTK